MKKSRFIIWSICLAGFTASTGCYTAVNVKKVDTADKKTPGIRYSLPATFIVATPKKDGTVTFEKRYFPDPENTYAIDSKSILAKHKLDVTLKDGLLAKVGTADDSSDLGAAMANGAGSIAEKQIGARQKEDEKTREKQIKAIDDANAVVKAAKQTVESAITSENKARDALQKKTRAQELKPDDTAAQLAVIEAEIDVARAVADVGVARDRLSEAEAGLIGLTKTTTQGGNIATAGNEMIGPLDSSGQVILENKSQPTAASPRIYRVMYGLDGTVRLRPARFIVGTKDDDVPKTGNAVAGKNEDSKTESVKNKGFSNAAQVKLLTSAAIKKEEKSTTPRTPRLYIAGPALVTYPGKDRAANLRIIADGPVAPFSSATESKAVRLSRPGTNDLVETLILNPSGPTQFHVTFPPGIAPGTYDLVVPYSYGTTEDLKNAPDAKFQIWIQN